MAKSKRPTRNTGATRTKSVTRRPAAKKAAAEGAAAEPQERSGVVQGGASASAADGRVIARGPRKRRRKGGPAPRWSNHKRRAVWFQSRSAWPLREPSIEHLLKERRRVAGELATAPVAAQWEMAGPTNIGGRCTSLICDPVNPDHILLGSAGGGVWRSDDGGRTWATSWNQQDVLNIGALAADPADANVVYCGTGEANLSADSYPGVGLFRSTDRGLTWTLLALSSGTGLPRRIGAIAVDPFDPSHLFVGGVGYSEEEPGGLFESNDGGATWTRLNFISANNYWCHAILFHPMTRDRVFVTVTERGSRNGIWRSTDGGKNWVQLLKGLPPAPAMSRTSIAIAPSKPEVMWAQVADASDRVLGVFRCGNGGDSWANVAGSHFGDEGQMSYGNSIVVHPTDPDTAICGGVDLHRTTNGGATWRTITRWDADRGDANYAHADHHALLMPAARPGLVLDGNDGGLDVSADAGTRWENRSSGLAATMFYDLDVAQTDARRYGGGAQDNGTLITESGSASDHSELLGGDGGWIVFDPGDAHHIYASFQHMGLYRWRAGQPPKSVQPPADASERGAVWMAFVTFDPSDTRTVFVGGLRVWRTLNDGVSWVAVSDILDNSPITALEVASADSKYVYVGTENGGFFRSTDGGRTWSGNLAGATLPGRSITRIESAPRNAQMLFVTVANSGNSHVFRSDNGGVSWVDVDQGRLPDVPHHALLIRPDADQELYVANDAGVFVSPDLGVTWQSIKRNLPNVLVVDLVYQERDKLLMAATYGRSSWKLKL